MFSQQVSLSATNIPFAFYCNSLMFGACDNIITESVVNAVTWKYSCCF